ncbi:MAG: PAS domain S-box protein [Firmicutes bacterium]|nr:PAS domain S-box protein [Bacillota bacterium]
MGENSRNNTIYELEKVKALLVDDLPEGIIITDLNGRIIYVNKSTEQYTGWASNDVLGQNPIFFNSEKNASGLKQEIINKLRHNKYWSGEIFQKRKDGSNYFAEYEIFPIQKNGTPVAWASIQRDITKRKQAEEQLRFSEERFSKAFNASPSMMSIKSYPDFKFIEVNEYFVEATGYSLDDVINRTPKDIGIFGDDLVHQKLVKQLKQDASIKNIEVIYITKSGEERIALISLDIIKIQGEKYVLAVAKDITEEKRLEEEMAQLERLNIVGQMAAGIGHEIRNPMTTVRGLLQLLSKKQECQEFSDSFNIMIEELNRANSIINEFLSIARSKPDELELKNLNDVINKILPLIEASALIHNVEVLFIQGNIPNVLMNEKEIRQLIFNLINNGMEAAPNKVITIRTYSKDDKAILAVTDQGGGFDADILKRLGTPFITTKEQGTGLGLAICFSISARHNARIDIESSKDGTVINVEFNSEEFERTQEAK